MCTYPSQSVKISIYSWTFSKNFPIRRLMPFQYIPFFLMLIYFVLYSIQCYRFFSSSCRLSSFFDSRKS